MQETIFSKIIAREIPAEIVYETDEVLAFLDITPVNPGHVLVIPKTYARNILDIAAEPFASVMEAARVLAPAVMRAAGAQGINVIMNNEPAAGQVVFHAHVHIVPRFEGDGHEAWHGAPYPDGRIAEVARQIRSELA